MYTQNQLSDIINEHQNSIISFQERFKNEIQELEFMDENTKNTKIDQLYITAQEYLNSTDEQKIFNFKTTYEKLNNILLKSCETNVGNLLNAMSDLASTFLLKNIEDSYHLKIDQLMNLELHQADTLEKIKDVKKSLEEAKNNETIEINEDKNFLNNNDCSILYKYNDIDDISALDDPINIQYIKNEMIQNAKSFYSSKNKDKNNILIIYMIEILNSKRLEKNYTQEEKEEFSKHNKNVLDKYIDSLLETIKAKEQNNYTIDCVKCLEKLKKSIKNVNINEMALLVYYDSIINFSKVDVEEDVDEEAGKRLKSNQYYLKNV